jgi:hypothetical protein
MKKLLSVFAITALLFSIAPAAKSQEVSVDFFYDNLNDGSWIEVGDYGYCWQPDVAVNDSSWRPYADGYWAYTDDGWTWVSYEDFGWATYHYGRWVRLTDYGWVWKPGYEWGPAWVSWRTGGNYIGWAPLPPETEYVYESRPITGHIDVEFDIGPAYYNFCDVRYIGEPVLRSRLVPYQQNITYITQTVNVTNITYHNKTVYNYGPDINVVNQYSSRPIQRLKLERQTNVDVSSAAKSGGLTKVQGNALMVAVPTKINKPTNEVAPAKVKTRVAQPKFERGWSQVGDANAQTQLKEKLKTQDLKTVPPPTLGAPVAKTSAAPNASAGMSASSEAAATSPFEKGKGKGKNKGRNAEQVLTSGPAGPGISPATTQAFPEGGKKKGKRADQNQSPPMTSPMAGSGAETSPSAIPESGRPGKGGKNRRGDEFGATPPPSGQMSGGEGMNVPENRPKAQGSERNFGTSPSGMSPQENPNEPRGGKRNKFEQQQPEMSPTNQPGGGTTPQGISDEPRGDKQKRFERQQPGPPPSSQSGAPGAYAPSNANPGSQTGPPAGSEGLGRRRTESMAGPGVGQPTGRQQQGGKHEEKKKSGPESPAPSPQ